MFVDLTILPELPTATKVESVLEETILFPKVTPLISVVIVEVELFQDEALSVDLTIFPLAPTATKVSFP